MIDTALAPVVSIGQDHVLFARGRLAIEVTLRPFAVTVRRDGRRLLRGAGAWIADGTVHDHFVMFTEGVVPAENLSPLERASRAEFVEQPDAASVTLALRFATDRSGELVIALPAPDTFTLELRVDGAPLRQAIDWDRRSVEHFAGLGARHCTEFDHRGRTIQLGADRRYTGPDCPPEMLSEGGIPQGDCAPVPWLESSRGYGVLVRTNGNGTKFDLSSDRTTVSTRTICGPLRLEFHCAGTPAARLRALCRDTGFPAVLPEWGYGFWKSRDLHEDQAAVFYDFDGLRRHQIALDAVVIDSPWASQYNSWEFNPFQFEDAPAMVRRMREDGVRTVLWCTPWVNLDSRDGQIPPQPESERLHHEPAPNYAEGDAQGHFVRAGDPVNPGPAPESADYHDHPQNHSDLKLNSVSLTQGSELLGTAIPATAPGFSWVGQWWMGTGSLVDFTNPAAERWWREQVKRVLELGVEGIKMDDGDGYYVPDDAAFFDGRSGAEVAWENGSLHRLSLQRALDEVHPGAGVLFGRSGWIGQHATGITWAADQASDFWSLKVLLVATLQAAMSGFSNWSHDIGGYLGHRLVERCPPELLVRWLQFGCFTPLMQAHSRMAHEPWEYGEQVTDLYRGSVLLHEMLVPYVRAAAATAARAGLPIIRPLALIDPTDERASTLSDAYGYGPSLWVAPVLDDGAREREVSLPRGEWIESWSQKRVKGGGEMTVEAPLERIPAWVRAGSIVVTYPADHVARGLGDTPEGERPLEATLWGIPRDGRALARLADGTRIRWSTRDGWSVSAPREVSYRVIDS
jgi:alpha-glucosidase (family GH31 glycosyl hydrolase)